MDLKRRILYLEKEREKERGERHPEVYVSDDAGQEGDEQLLPGQEGDGQLLRGGMPPRGRKQWENFTPKLKRMNSTLILDLKQLKKRTFVKIGAPENRITFIILSG